MIDRYIVSIKCHYDFGDPVIREQYDEWRDDHPDTEMMRLGFVWDRFGPDNIMSMVDPNSRKEISYE
jgi:hypothetical protein